MKKKLHLRLWAVMAGLLIVTVLLNVLAWNSAAFCDWYVRWIFPAGLAVWGRFCGMFPFPVGDVFLAAVALWLLTCLLACILAIFFRGKVWQIAKRCLRFTAILLCVTLFILTVNWWMLYHTTPLGENTDGQSDVFLAQQLMDAYNHVAEEVNRLSQVVPRTEEGVPYCDTDIHAEAIASMQALKELEPRLGGFYPAPKKMLFSDFFSQQYISGYYFPVTMEANINTRMMEINVPYVTCHELAHLKGYIREDEANFLAFLACIQSENAFFQYSGYLGIVNFLEDDIAHNPNCDGLDKVARNAVTYQDDVFLSAQAWEEVESSAVISTEIVGAVSDTLVDTSLKLNGVNDGKISYSRVVELILQYYERSLYE